MAFVLNEKQRTQLAVERASEGSSLDTLRTLAQLPPALAWRAGEAVASLPPGSLRPGTLIAHFDAAGQHPAGTPENRLAIYLGHDSGQIQTLAPDPDSPKGRWKNVRISLQLPAGVRAALDGNTYHVVEW